jgi:hypothetical protein
MYKSTETIRGPPKRKNEWCEMDYEKVKYYPSYFAVSGFTLLIMILTVALIDLNHFYPVDFIFIIIIFMIGLVIMIYVAIIIKRKLDNAVLISYSYSIKIDFSKQDLGKTISSTKRYLSQNKIAFELIGDQPDENFGLIQFHRKDNLHAFVSIMKLSGDEMRISIYPNDFDDKSKAIELRDVIWDEKKAGKA